MKMVFLIGSICNSGGIERVTANLANMWAENGNEIEIVVLCKEKTSFFSLNTNIKIISLNIEQYVQGNIFSIVKWYCLIIWKFRSYLKKNKIDIVLGIWTSMATCAILAAKFLNVSVVACEHIAYYEVKKELQILRKYIYPWASGIVSLTEHDRLLYKKLNKNAVTIPNAISLDQQRKIDYDAKIVLAVGRLTPQKGFDLLIEAWSKLSKKYPEWTLKIIGRKDYQYKKYIDNLYKLIEKNNLQKQILIEKPTNSIFDEYEKASIFVMSSRFEGLPMVLLESMSVGLPVVSFDCPTGPKEIIKDKKSGILVEKENVVKLADGLKLLMGNKLLRQQMGHSAKNNICYSFNEGHVKELWKDFIENILRRKNQ